MVPPQKMQRCSDRDSDRERSEAALMRLWASRGPPPSPLASPQPSPPSPPPSPLPPPSPALHRRSVPSTHRFFSLLSLFCMRLARPSKDLSSTGNGTRRTGGREGGGVRAPVKRAVEEGWNDRENAERRGRWM